MPHLQSVYATTISLTLALGACSPSGDESPLDAIESTSSADDEDTGTSEVDPMASEDDSTGHGDPSETTVGVLDEGTTEGSTDHGTTESTEEVVPPDCRPPAADPDRICPDPDAPGVWYVDEDPVACCWISILCLPDTELFDDACGCGCIATDRDTATIEPRPS
jgi:hypothetical protein